MLVITGATGQVAEIIRDTSLHVEISEVTETVWYKYSYMEITNVIQTL